MAEIKVTDLKLPGVKIIEPRIFSDNRGYSGETYSIQELEKHGIAYNFVLDYEAYNMKKYTLRGIHFQNNPHPQTKLVRVLSGEILDFVVDLRKDSPTYKKWISHKLSSENHKQILIPNGFGHAFVTTKEDTTVLYKFDDYYNGQLVRTICWNDPEIGIEWPDVEMVMSEGDRNAVCLRDSDVNFSIKENK